MKKTGFTLAEVLVTLGIIGVVAALTAPALTKNTGTAKIGPTLSKFVNTWETATEQMMNDQQIDKYSNFSTGLSEDSNILNALSRHMIMSRMRAADKSAYRYHAPDGSGSRDLTNPNNTDGRGFDAFVLKDGSMIWGDVAPVSTSSMTKRGVYSRVMGSIYIDINGPAGNNRVGKEVFAFEVDDSGTLIPYQSTAYFDQWPNAARVTCSTTSNNFNQGLACTGKYADNNWKAEN